ncbi:PREDICTED: melanoma-associated antigen B2 [Colobus angolensis palliatus]|uniref:melanoma-associated antigen B2 n=1 Tax=Colobus angolensis palliatus TaxID=336983 RepID=UPI0005F46E8F|nr:PREDICTED: melanoma-associated antigen B2 [Colobus angolensis palliatus]XP_011815199.1 PREDICTED: melanoma-associated antigen B2 [Colobus angolensis palliatus]
MPRGQKSKLRAREKRRKAREETQGLNAPQVTEAEEEEAPCCSSSVSGGAASSSPAAGIPQKPQRAPTTAAAAGVSSTKSKKGAKSQGEKKASSSQASTSTESSSEDPLSRKTGMLVQFLLCKCKIKESVTKGEMLKIVGKRFREHFPDILKKASERLNLVFGLELNKVKPSGHTYTFNKVDPTDEEGLLGTWDFPRNGLLMPLLGVIFLNGNSATEEEIWEFLNMLGVYDGEKHLVFGEPRKLITQDLVEEKYLEYKQVPNSDPPRYQFLWGPRAYAETSKMKVLEFLAKVNGTTPCAFPAHYEEALRDEGKARV